MGVGGFVEDFGHGDAERGGSWGVGGCRVSYTIRASGNAAF